MGLIYYNSKKVKLENVKSLKVCRDSVLEKILVKVIKFLEGNKQTP